MAKRIANVIVDSPIREPLDYLVPADLEIQVGQRCLVPFGTRKMVGIVVGFSEKSRFSKLKEIISRVDDISPLSPVWLALTSFAARYYQSGWGLVAIPSLPKFFRKIPGKLHERSLERLRKKKNRRLGNLQNDRGSIQNRAELLKKFSSMDLFIRRLFSELPEAEKLKFIST